MEKSAVKEVYFQSILIADLQKNTARFQEFSKGLNVVTSVDNHVGKSSLLKALYYTLGAEVDYDPVWDKNTKLYIATIQVDDEIYRIARLMKRFAVFHFDKLISITDSVTKELSPLLGDIFDFAVYLPNKESEKVEMAPPAFTFMPYYIDQDKGWSGLYNSFSSIEQYKKPDRIKSLYYHLNIYTKSTVELMAKRDWLKDELETLQKESERLQVILTALNGEIENLPPADNMEELEEQLEIPKERIRLLMNQVGETRNVVQEGEIALTRHQQQLHIVQNYQLPIADKGTQTVYTCPHCGYTFDEEIFNIVRTNYSEQNEEYLCQQIQLIIDSVSQKLAFAKERYVSLMEELKREEEAFHAEKDEFELYVRRRGLQDSVRRFSGDLNKVRIRNTEIIAEIKEISKEIRRLPNKKDVEEKYIECVRLNIIALDAWNPAYEGNIKLLQPIKAQGTLENKIILAQFVGLFQTMDYFKSSATRFPFVVDSPRAKEASLTSSKDILKMIAQLEMLPQIILATIDFEDFKDEIKTPTTVITLTEQRKLLRDSDYINNADYITAMAELLKNP